MFLVNMPKFRVRKYNSGWIVEIQKRKWYGKKYWIHIIPFAGCDDEPFIYSTSKAAVEETLKIIGWEIWRVYKYRHNKKHIY